MLKSLAEKIHIFGRGGEFCFRIPGEGGFQNSQINLEIEFYTKKKKPQGKRRSIGIIGALSTVIQTVRKMKQQDTDPILQNQNLHKSR